MTAIAPELVRCVPGCESGNPPLAVQRLTGGRGANSVWRLHTSAGNFVLRLRHGPDRPGSTSRFELASHRLAAAAGLAPRLVDAAPDGGWLLMEYVAAPTWTEARLLSDTGIDLLGDVLQRVHALNCEALPRMDVAGIAREHLALIRKSTAMTDSGDRLLAAIEQDSRELAGFSSRAVLNHGDLMAANLIGPAGAAAPLLLDWEYAQRTDPTWDVACLLEYYPDLGQKADRLLRSCGLAMGEDQHILSLTRRLFAGLNRLWQQTGTGNWIS